MLIWWPRSAHFHFCLWYSFLYYHLIANPPKILMSGGVFFFFLKVISSCCIISFPHLVGGFCARIFINYHLIKDLAKILIINCDVSYWMDEKVFDTHTQYIYIYLWGPFEIKVNNISASFYPTTLYDRKMIS